MENRRVLVVGAEENPSLCIIESLARQGMEVCAASHKRVCVGFFSRFVSRRFLYPSWALGEEAFLARIIEIISRQRFEAVFVAGEQPSFILCKHKKEIERYSKIPTPDFATYMKCRDKSVTMKLAAASGVPVPRSYFPEETGIDQISRQVEYPVVIKPNSSNGARGIEYPSSAGELLQAYQRVSSIYGPCHVQEYIPHSGMQYKAEVLLDGSLKVKAWCLYNKPRYYPPTGGSSTVNCTVERQDILDYAVRILKQIGWVGLGDCDFILDPRDNIPKLMEINPRITRSIKICMLAGVDFPFLLYKLARGEELPDTLIYKKDIYLRYLFSDIFWFFKSPERFRAKPNFFWFFGKNLRDEVISFKDPGPALAYLLSSAAALFNKKEREFRLR
ncbi:MAG: ATP-grasp domain-containing protein [Candidatus Omnitrophica bacterium]|nr:ATP-grasp domain-containing protein [Candidatus Omnitrophota bacterium]